jgi:formylglycine-generating enzyme required for sulfatase activity
MCLSFDRAIAMHAEMAEVPASDKVCIGEPSPNEPSGPIQDAAHVPAFKIDRTEVTDGDYAIYLNDAYGEGNPFDNPPSMLATMTPPIWTEAYQVKTPGVVPAGLDKHPVRGVTYDEACAFAKWAGKRLPDEVEWEYAARGESYYVMKDGNRTKHDYPWGTVNQADKLKFPSYCRYEQPTGELEPTKQVGSYEGTQSPFGLYDMAGNVAEWTSSDFLVYKGCKVGADYPFGGGHKVVRGGSFRVDREFPKEILEVLDKMDPKDKAKFFAGSIAGCRCAVRDYYLPGERHNWIGFRCMKPAGAEDRAPAKGAQPGSQPK